MEHHSLDIDPIPSEKEPMYINEPWLIDSSLLESKLRKEPESSLRERMSMKLIANSYNLYRC